jgi:hypothetical protein
MNKSELKQLIKEEISKILNEEKTEKEITSDAEKALQKSLVTLKSGLSQVKISPKNKEAASKNKEVNEAIGWTIYNLVVGAPGLLSLLGKAVDGVSNFLVLDKNQDGTLIGRALNKASHKLEHAYLDIIGLALQKAYPDLYLKSMDVHDENFPLYDAARKIYISLLVAGGIGAGFSAASAHSLIHKAVEVGEIGMKAAEVVNLAKAIASSPA